MSAKTITPSIKAKGYEDIQDQPVVITWYVDTLRGAQLREVAEGLGINAKRKVAEIRADLVAYFEAEYDKPKTNAEALAATDAVVVRAVADDMPRYGVRAVLVNFKTNQGEKKVAFDRYRQSIDYDTWNNLNHMISNAVAAVVALPGIKVETYTIWLVRG